MSPAAGLYLGSISGTSVDGLDLALLELGPDIRFVASTTIPFPAALQDTLLALGQPENDDLDLLGTADTALGEFISAAVLQFLADENLTPGQITALGSHGQTVRHRPDQDHPFTWQIGDPNTIAERTGITTVADFRRRDMAAGGQGAPLVPRFHQALFHSAAETRAVLNIGGISNLTVLPNGANGTVTGFDCGPGNALLDAWCQRHRGTRFDPQGAWAATGAVNGELLARLLADPYLQRSPPKSTGREYYNLLWLEDRLTGPTITAADVQRTLLEFTSASIQGALDRWAAGFQRVIVCGGGRLNPVLLNALADRLSAPVESSDSLGFDGDAIEAAAFAWLAAQRMRQATGSAASVTGAGGDRVLGGVYPG